MKHRIQNPAFSPDTGRRGARGRANWTTEGRASDGTRIKHWSESKLAAKERKEHKRTRNSPRRHGGTAPKTFGVQRARQAELGGGKRRLGTVGFCRVMEGFYRIATGFYRIGVDFNRIGWFFCRIIHRILPDKFFSRTKHNRILVRGMVGRGMRRRMRLPRSKLTVHLSALKCG